MNTATAKATVIRSALLLFLAGLGLQVAACGSADTATPLAYCQALQTATMNMWYRCAAEPKNSWGDGFGVGYCQDLADGVKAKRIAYDATAAAACLKLLKDAACTPAAMYPADNPCTKAIRGLVPDGGACGSVMDCGSSSYCDVSGGTCPGTCTAEVKAGGDCSSGQICASTTYCDGHVCQPFAANGASCSDTNGPFCDIGLYCSSGGTCVPQVAAGGACTKDWACQDFDACYGGTCSQIHGVGQSCTDYNNCGGALYCSSGKCVEMPLASGACGYIADGFVQCLASGYHCHITDFNAYTGTCAPQASAGQACAPGDPKPCHDGYCDTTSKTCVAACHETSVK